MTFDSRSFVLLGALAASVAAGCASVGGPSATGGTLRQISADAFARAGNASSLKQASRAYSKAGHAALYDIVGSTSPSGCTTLYLCTGLVGYDGPSGNGTPKGVGAF